MCSRIPAWKRLTGHERISLITTIFSDRDVIGVIERLRGDDAQFFVDMVDKVFLSFIPERQVRWIKHKLPYFTEQALDSLTPRLRKKCLRALCKICGRQALLPRSLQIPLCYNRLDNALYSGGYADVWMGEHQGRKVAVKVLRLYSTSNLGKVINVGRRRVLATSAYFRADYDYVEVLQGSCDMEKPLSSECASAIGSDNE